MFKLELQWPIDRPLLLACSGGSDSLALLYLLRSHPWPLEVAHLDHRGRPDSHLQTLRLNELCREFRLPFHSRRLRVGSWARRYHMSWEAAGRELRYLWLRKLAEQRGALLVTAHTADDQAETLLIRILRGCTLTGLAGIQPQGRPLLAYRRSQLRQYLQRLGVTWFEDPANSEEHFLRVAVRQRLLPLMEELNPKVVRNLNRLAQDARQLPPGPSRLEEMSRLQFEHWIHQQWLNLRPGPVPWSRCHAQEIYAAMASSNWRSWNLPGKIWAEWDGQRLALGLAQFPLPGPAPEGHRWRTRQAGDLWQGRLLKKILPAWGMPRQLRDRLPILIKEPHQVVCVPGWSDDQERSGVVIVEAAPRDEHATPS